MELESERNKVEKYIYGVERVLEEIREKFPENIDKKYREVIDLAKSYVSDARYYLDKGDVFTSLACIAYAEGLLDALRIQGVVDFTWPKEHRRKVLVGGAFEILHPGHIYFLKEAWKQGRVVVVLARDKTIKRFKGRSPVLGEKYRKIVLESLKYVDKVIFGYDEMNIKAILEREKPDVVVLGPDQDALLREVRQAIEELGLKDVKVVKVKGEFDNKICRTSKIIEKIRGKHSSLTDSSCNLCTK